MWCTYNVYLEGDSIILWCDSKNEPPWKGKNFSDSEVAPLSKCEAKEEEERKIFVNSMVISFFLILSYNCGQS